MSKPEQDEERTFLDTLPEQDQGLYSLNFLIAKYRRMQDRARGKALLANEMRSSRHHSRNYEAERFYRPVTTPLANILGLARAPTIPTAGAGQLTSPTTAPAASGRYFLLWACCVPVRGHTRSVLCDLQRGAFLFVPQALVEVTTLCRTLTVAEVYARFDHEHDAEIDNYLAHLVAEDYGFFTDEPERFPAMALEFRNPLAISNCVVDFDPDSTHSVAVIAPQLSALGCQAVELRFFYSLPLQSLDEHLAPFDDSTVRSISVVLGHHPSFTEPALRELLVKRKRLRQVVISACPTTEVPRVVEIHPDAVLIFTAERVDSENHCGNVSSPYFGSNIQRFTEAMAFNSCLNRKLGIDARGAIRNCPALPRSFGQVETTTLAEVVSQSEFQASWTVTKDHVLVCQDCEFRYMCHDCRAFVADPGNPLSKPAKCTYDPYTARWAGAETSIKG